MLYVCGRELKVTLGRTLILLHMRKLQKVRLLWLYWHFLIIKANKLHYFSNLFW